MRFIKVMFFVAAISFVFAGCDQPTKNESAEEKVKNVKETTDETVDDVIEFTDKVVDTVKDKTVDGAQAIDAAVEGGIESVKDGVDATGKELDETGKEVKKKIDK